MRPALLTGLLLLGAGCAPSSGGAGPSAPAAASSLPPEMELEIRDALHDALYGKDAQSDRGRDRIRDIGKPAVPILVQALADEDRLDEKSSGHSILETRVRRQKLAILLGEARDPRAIGPLLERYDGEPFARALEKITGLALGDRLEAWREWYVDQPPADTSPAEIEKAVRLFRSQPVRERLQTMQDLAYAVRVRTGAAQLLDTTDPQVRTLTTRRQSQTMTVADLDRRRAARTLLAAGFQDPEPAVRNYAKLVAIQLGPLAVSSLRPLTRGGPPETRLPAIRTLGEIGDPRARPELEAALADPVTALRFASAQALGQIGGPAAAAPLEAGLRGEKDPEVRAALLGGLAMCGRTDRFQDLLAMLAGPQKDLAAAQLEAVCRKAYTLDCQSVHGLRIPATEEAWREYWRRQALGTDSELWKRWWTQAKVILSPLPGGTP